MSEAIDWRLAHRVGSTLVDPGPQVSRDAARSVVAELYECAELAKPLVRDLTGLQADASSVVRVIDRPAWIEANARGMSRAVLPLMDRLDEKNAPDLVLEIGARGTALELGTVLSWMASKVLGQFDVFADPGQLLLVAPNVVEVERKLGVPTRDFRQWVCLHEEAHRVQFGAVPWLRDHLMGLVAEFIDASDLTLRDLVAAVNRVVRAISTKDASLIEAAQTPAQLAVFERMNALMTVLEGHADVVMDLVGPSVIPSLDSIRTRFDARRASASRTDAVIRRAIGMDAKLRQYTEGAKFVRLVIDVRGMAGFNRVWESPEMLPTMAEIRTPRLWFARVPA